MIGTTAALIGLGIMGGSQVAGAAMQARGASNAAKAQNAALDKALAFNRMLWGQQQQQYQPFINTGHSANAMMARLMGFPMGGPGGPPVVGPRMGPPSRMLPPGIPPELVATYDAPGNAGPRPLAPLMR